MMTDMSKMKIVFMGTPDFAVPCLERLCDENYQVVSVITQPDKPRGRKQELTPSEVKAAALKRGLTVYQPQSLKTDEAYEYIKSLEPDFLIVVAYGKLLPKRILDLPVYGCINVHGSLLPKYRGAAPIQRCVLAGDKIAGVTTMLMNEGLDTGDMLLTKSMELSINATSGEVFDALAAAAPELLIETIEKYVKKEITPQPQRDEDATYAPMLSKEEAIIDWSRSAEELHNLVRGMSPWPVAYTFLENKKLKIFSTLLTDEESSLEAGRIVTEKNQVFAVCGDGKLLKINSLQLEGGKRLGAWEFFIGHRELAEARLGECKGG